MAKDKPTRSPFEIEELNEVKPVTAGMQILPATLELDINKISSDLNVLADEINQCTETVKHSIMAIGVRVKKIHDLVDSRQMLAADFEAFCNSKLKLSYKQALACVRVYENLPLPVYHKLQNYGDSTLGLIARMKNPESRERVIDYAIADKRSYKQIAEKIKFENQFKNLPLPAGMVAMDLKVYRSMIRKFVRYIDKAEQKYDIRAVRTLVKKTKRILRKLESYSPKPRKNPKPKPTA